MGKALPQSAAVMVEERGKNRLRPSAGGTALTTVSRGVPGWVTLLGGTPYKVLGRAGASAVSPRHSHTRRHSTPERGAAGGQGAGCSGATVGRLQGCRCSLQPIPSLRGVPRPPRDPNQPDAKQRGPLSLRMARDSKCLGRRRRRTGRQAGGMAGQAAQPSRSEREREGEAARAREREQKSVAQDVCFAVSRL